MSDLTPANFYISGQSQCGKSYLVQCMLRNLNELFDPVPSRIIYCYGEYQHAFDDMVQTIPNIYFTEGFPDNLYGILEGYQNSLVIIDDLMSECSKDHLGVSNVSTQYKFSCTIFPRCDKETIWLPVIRFASTYT